MSTALYLALSHAATSTTVTLSGGTDTFTGVSFRVTKLDIGVAQLVPGAITRRSSYGSVNCSIGIEILAASADACWSTLNNIYKLFSIAQDWYNGTPFATPVLINFSPDGSTTTSDVSPLTSVLMRPIGQGITLTSHEPTRGSAGWTLSGVTLSFERQGEWCYPYSSASAYNEVSSASTASTARTQTITLSAASTTDIPHPLGISLYRAGVGTGGSPKFNGTLLMTESASALQIAVVTGSGSGFSSVADTGNFPLSGSLITRCTPTSTTTFTLLNAVGASTLTENMIRPVFFLSLRNNSTSYSYRVRLRLSYSGSGNYTYTPYRVVDGSTTNVRVFAFPGEVKGMTDNSNIDVQVVASASGGTLDLNAIAVLDSAEKSSQVISFGDTGVNIVYRNPLINDDRAAVTFDEPGTGNEHTYTHRTAPTTIWKSRILSATTPVIYGNTMYAAPMVSTAGYWAPITSASAQATMTIKVMRRDITLTPR